MKKDEFIKILECVLRCADSHIDMVGQSWKEKDSIQIHYDDDIVYSVPVTGKSPLGILCEAAIKCQQVRDLNDLEQELEKIDSMRDEPIYSFEDWKQSAIGQEETDKILYYLYRMYPVEKDYIFGKMAAMLLANNSVSRLYNEDE